MSSETKLQIHSLARDPSGHLAAGAGALRKAENIVIRAPGVAESRPNFDLYLEKMAATTLTLKALHEFNGAPVAIEYDTSSGYWTIRDLATNTLYTAPVGATSDPAKPIAYDTTETRFAEMRKSIYLTTFRGIAKIDSSTNYTTGLDWSGVEMLAAHDWVTGNVNLYPLSGTQYAWAYQAVFVRKDANGYVRRSPPSERWVVTSTVASAPTGATRFYFSGRLRAGDIVEIYRSRMATDTAPSAELFLCMSHTITAGEKTATRFLPRVDATVMDDQLGVALYTSPSQGGALAAKYTPPRAQVMAPFASCMWYGRATSKARAVMTLRSMGMGGLMRGNTTTGGGVVCDFTIGLPTVTTASTIGLVVGADFTDQYTFGPTAAGTYVPALTKILSMTATVITMTANAIATGSAYAGNMSRSAPIGIAAGIGDGTGTMINNDDYVTGLSSTARMRVGMGWSDSLANGPATAGTNTRANTRILEIVSASVIRLTKTAQGNGTGAYAYDCVEVATYPFYAWPSSTTALTTPVWNWPLQCVPFGPVYYGSSSIQSFITNLATAVNYLSIPTDLRVRAIPVGDTNLDLLATSDFANTIIFEETDGTGNGMPDFITATPFYTPFTIVPSCPTAFDSGEATVTSSIDDRPNRLWWSSPDEPESVPLLNYADIGDASQPILALAPLSGALLVFTQRGIYRVTGSAPNSWSVDVVDPTLRLIRPEAVTVMDDKAYAWCDRGIFEVTANGARSISAGLIDEELHLTVQYIYGSSCHGVFTVAWPARNIVLFGIPGSLSATKTTTLYCYSTVTRSFTEWPLAWGVAAESKNDNLYHSRAASALVLYEARSAKTTITGYDRVYSLASIVSYSSLTLVVPTSSTGQWEPVVGDMVAAVSDGIRQYRRITAVALSGDYTFTLESAITGSLTVWKGYEVAKSRVVIEWHPQAPAGIPTGAVCREIHAHVDLRAGPDATEDVSVPEYKIGGTSEMNTSQTTITSNRTRANQIQSVRVGCSRAIARSALIAPYFASSDIFALRVNGLSMIFEGTSEKTRK